MELFEKMISNVQEVMDPKNAFNRNGNYQM